MAKQASKKLGASLPPAWKGALLVLCLFCLAYIIYRIGKGAAPGAFQDCLDSNPQCSECMFNTAEKGEFSDLRKDCLAECAACKNV